MELFSSWTTLCSMASTFYRLRAQAWGQDALQTIQTSIWRNGKRSLCTKQHSGDTYDAGCAI